MIQKKLPEGLTTKLNSVKSLSDCTLNYSTIDSILAQVYEEKNAANKQFENEKIDYKFDEVYLKNLKPQMLDKLTAYDEAFTAIETQEDVRNHPKMVELKQLHDIIHFIRLIIWGGNLENLHFDISGHVVRTIINRNQLIMGEFPEILYRRYLDKNLSFIKLKNIFGRVLKQLESEDYDD